MVLYVKRDRFAPNEKINDSCRKKRLEDRGLKLEVPPTQSGCVVLGFFANPKLDGDLRPDTLRHFFSGIGGGSVFALCTLRLYGIDTLRLTHQTHQRFLWMLWSFTAYSVCPKSTRFCG